MKDVRKFAKLICVQNETFWKGQLNFGAVKRRKINDPLIEYLTFEWGPALFKFPEANYSIFGQGTVPRKTVFWVEWRYSISRLATTFYPKLLFDLICFSSLSFAISAHMGNPSFSCHVLRLKNLKKKIVFRKILAVINFRIKTDWKTYKKKKKVKFLHTPVEAMYKVYDRW